MVFFLYKFFHRKTNEREKEGVIPISEDRSAWPESWKNISYKNYTLFKPILLPSLDGTLWKLLKSRRSDQVSLSNNDITFDKISYIVKCGYGLQNPSNEIRAENRTVPSAGQRYPVEMYLFLFTDVGVLTSGVYHYGIKHNSLEPVRISEFTKDKVPLFSSQEIVKDSSGMICLTAVFNRSVEKYGNRGYRHTLLEAGHVAQNIVLAGTEKDINFVPIGGSDEDAIEKYIGLNGANEGVVYTLFF